MGHGFCHISHLIRHLSLHMVNFITNRRLLDELQEDARVIDCFMSGRGHYDELELVAEECTAAVVRASVPRYGVWTHVFDFYQFS